MHKNLNLAQNLRKNNTKEENIIWQLLRNRKFYGYKFKRQVPIGNYIVDFLCYEKSIVVEIDGGEHNTPDALLKDKNRTQYLESQGYKVIRFCNSDVNNNIQGVYEKLMEILVN